MDYKKHIRDIKLDLITNRIILKTSPPKIGGLLSFIRPGTKVIKELLKCGSILTGSRALKCYEVNNKPILDRAADDWDFIVDEKTLFKICDKYKFSQGIKKDTDGDYYVSINSCAVRITHSYGRDTEVLKTNITLICKNEPGFIETKSGKIANLPYILDEKYKLSNSVACRYMGVRTIRVIDPMDKHALDLKQIIARMYNI